MSFWEKIKNFFLSKETEEKADPTSRIVTTAVDTSTISKEKLEEDMKKLGILTKNLEESGKIVSVVTEDTPMQKALKLVNPFKGE